MSAIVISSMNNKGGVGKSTSTGILSQLTALLGKRTLGIDMDPQSNLSMLLASYEDDPLEVLNGAVNSKSQNIHEIFKMRYRNQNDVENCIYHTGIPNLDVIPSSKRHKNTLTVLNMNPAGNNNIILKKAISTIKDNYDYIFIDNPPALDTLTVNSFFASDMVITPVRSENFSYKGLKETLDSMLFIRDEHDVNIDFRGAFMSQDESHTNVSKGLSDGYANELGAKFLPSIRKDIKISELETIFTPVKDLLICPKSRRSGAVLDYAHLLLALDILDKPAQLELQDIIEKYSM